MTHRILTVALGTLLAAAPMAGCGGGGTTPATLLVAIGLPASTDADTATFIRQGADLAVRELNRAGGVHTGGRTYTLQLRIHDDASDPQRAAANTRAAIAAGAVGVIEDGIGAALSAAGSASAGVPEVVVADGDSGLPAGRRSVFRLGIANDAAATVLGGDISHRAASVAILHDDGGDGRDGARLLEAALATAQVRVTADREVPAALPALDAEVRALLDAHPAAVALWASPAVTSRALQALHAAGSTLPVFSGPAAEDPAVRRVAGAAATEGLSFVASRMTSESDSVSFGQFEHRLAAAEGGPIDAGIRDSEGRELRQPADQALFSYDAVRVLAAALERAGPHPGAGLLAAMTAVGVTSANGDHRGFNPDNHEGVADDDLYIAAIHDMAFAPVRDEPLSATLPAPDEILADFG